jgi:isoquinoline 1-oxidoreductase subunit beta
MHALDLAQQHALADALAAMHAAGVPPASPTDPDTDIDTGRGATVSRRSFLHTGGAAGLVVGFGWLPGKRAYAATPRVSTAAPVGAPLAPNAFIRVGADNLVTIVCKHHEMGQGNTTGLATLAADELDADWSLVRTEYAPSNPKLYNNLAFGELQGTGGSTAIANSFQQMRTAGATARAMLVAAAAESWKVPPAEIKTANSVLSHASGKRATYGEMALAAGRLPAPQNVVLKQPAQYTLIGREKATPRVDSPSKCDGTAVYTIDMKLPGMLTAVIAFPPSFGAKVVSFDAAEALRVKGVTDVVQVPEGVAVVGTGMWAALKGRRALKVRWDESAGAGLDSAAVLSQYRAQAMQPGTPFVRPAATEPAPAAAVKTVEAVYEFPFLAHAPMEPMNCVAWLHDGMLETWGGHQFPSFDQMFAAKAAGLPMEKVVLHTLVSGGSFGRRANSWSDFTVAAVNVAVAIKGRAPVRLQYTREDDTGAGLYRPAYVHAVKVGLDAAGKVAGWQHTIVGQSIMAGGPMQMLVKDGVDPTSVEGVSPTPYAIPAMRGDLHSPVLPVKPLWWRSVGSTHTAFVMETMMDELAVAAGTDPVAFRLALLTKSDRAAGVLKLAAEKAGWGRPMAKGTAQGIAVHESFGTFVAQVAEVSVKDGKVAVDRVVCAVDCGVAVNPDVVRAQMEGCIGFGLGAMYYSEVEVKGGRAVQRNFDSYKSLRIHEMPKIEVHIVASSASPTGVGEPGLPPLAPAVANAMARLGVPRVRRLPLASTGMVDA